MMMKVGGQPYLAMIFHNPSLLTVSVVGEMHKDGVQVLVLFLAFLLQLSGGKNHASHAPASSESALALWLHVLLQVLQKTVQ
jgi:hypothetical protein